MSASKASRSAARKAWIVAWASSRVAASPRKKTTSATLPGCNSSLVRIAVHDETGTWNVYNAFAEPHQRLDFNLTVVGTSELDTYVNNELLGSTQLGAEPEQRTPQQNKNDLRP